MMAMAQQTDYDNASQVQQDRKLIQQALKIRAVICNNDAAQFFKILKSPDTNYFFGCLMVLFLKEFYKLAIEKLKDNYKTQQLPFDMLSRQLGFDEKNESSVKSLVVACGFKIDSKDFTNQVWKDEKAARRTEERQKEI